MSLSERLRVCMDKSELTAILGRPISNPDHIVGWLKEHLAVGSSDDLEWQAEKESIAKKDENEREQAFKRAKEKRQRMLAEIVEAILDAFAVAIGELERSASPFDDSGLLRAIWEYQLAPPTTKAELLRIVRDAILSGDRGAIGLFCRNLDGMLAPLPGDGLDKIIKGAKVRLEKAAVRLRNDVQARARKQLERVRDIESQLLPYVEAAQARLKDSDFGGRLRPQTSTEKEIAKLRRQKEAADRKLAELEGNKSYGEC